MATLRAHNRFVAALLLALPWSSIQAQEFAAYIVRLKPAAATEQFVPLERLVPMTMRAVDAITTRGSCNAAADRRFKTAVRAKALTDRLDAQPQSHRGYRLLWMVDGVQVRCTPEMATELRTRPEVERVEADPFLSISLPQPTAPRVASDAGAWQLNMIRASVVGEQSGLTGHGVTVGILDTGIVDSGPLKGRIAAYKDFTSHPSLTPIDPLGHGTAVASILAGAASPQGAGVAPQCRLVVARVLEELELPDSTAQKKKLVGAFASQIVQAMQWMLDPDGDPATDDAPRIVNNSWGFSDSQLLPEDYFRPAIDAWSQAGILAVFSAGNATDTATKYTFFPASYEQVLAVGSVGIDRSASIFTAVGRPGAPRIKPDLVAPGASVLAWNARDGYASFDGTSFSAPQVSGVAALLLEAWPELSRQQLFDVLTRSATDLGESGRDRLYGAGLVQAEAATAAVSALAQARLLSSPSLETFLTSLEALLTRSAQPFAAQLAASAAGRFALALAPKDRERLASLPRSSFPQAKPFLLAALQSPPTAGIRAAMR